MGRNSVCYCVGAALLATITFSAVHGQDAALTGTPCRANTNAAVAAFKNGDHETALEQVNQGLVQCPGNMTLVQLRGLILFAREEYHEASVAVHKVMGAGSGWSWATVHGMYSDAATYTKHLRALEAHTKKHPDDGPARFLQAYHYMVIDAPKAAARELEMVIRLEINDPIAADLLKKMRQL